jgi:hypothetical protein
MRKLEIPDQNAKDLLDYELLLKQSDQNQIRFCNKQEISILYIPWI